MAKSYIGDHAPFIFSGLRPVARGHRGHLGPRSPSLPPAGGPGPGPVRNATRPPSPGGRCRSGSEGGRWTTRRQARTIDAFRLRAREWLAEAMPRLPEGRDNASWSQEDEMGERARHLQRLLFDSGLRRPLLPRPSTAGWGLTRDPPAGVHPGVAALPDAHPVQCSDPVHPGPDPPRFRDRGTETAPSSGHPAGRGAVGPVPLGAQRRFRPGRAGDPGHQGRRHLRAQRVEDLEFGGIPLRLRHVPGPHRPARAQAPGPDHVHPQDPPAWHRGPADHHGQRDGRVLSGVLRRRGHSGGRT